MAVDHFNLAADLAKILPTLSVNDLQTLVFAVSVEVRQRALPGAADLSSAHIKLGEYRRAVDFQRRQANTQE